MKNIDKVRQMNPHDLANFISNKCNICSYRYKDCGNEMCSMAIEEYLNQEAKLTIEDIHREFKEFCRQNSCRECKYPYNGTCNYEFTIDKFNIIDGKITRR